MQWCLPRFSSASHGSSSTHGCRGGVPLVLPDIAPHTQLNSLPYRGSSGIWTLSSTFERASTWRASLSRTPGRLPSATSEAGPSCCHRPAPSSLRSRTEDGSFAIFRRFAFHTFWNGGAGVEGCLVPFCPCNSRAHRGMSWPTCT